MKKTTVYQMTAMALMAALMCVVGPMSVPIGPIPISFTNFVIYLAVWLLEGQAAAVSYCVYLLIGAVGLPVFSGYSGGLGKLAGPTGGYLIGFIFMAMICSIVTQWTNYHMVFSMAGMVLATAVAYGFGTLWFMLQAKATLAYSLMTCVVPFIPGDLVKIFVAGALGVTIRKSLLRSGLLLAKERVPRAR
ncbi:MAG TPA: biotin transporter BioY [Lachnospiraceae bacterium]|nr:biotin transporter BioY [Lachnospiraceae bacterium]